MSVDLDLKSLGRKGNRVWLASPETLEEACFTVPIARALDDELGSDGLMILSPEKLAPLWEMAVRKPVTYPEKAKPKQVAQLLKVKDGDVGMGWEDPGPLEAFQRVGLSRRFGFENPKTTKFLTHSLSPVQNPGPIRHRVRTYLDAVHDFLPSAADPRHFEPIQPRTESNHKSLVMIPGSDYGASAEWPYFATLLDSLLEGGRHEVHLVETEGSELAADLHRNFPATKYHPYDVDSLIALFRTSARVIASDGSLPHLAALCGAKVLTIFGPNEPAWKRPMGRNHTVIRHHAPCSPCFLPKCPLDHRCLKMIPADEVFARFCES